MHPRVFQIHDIHGSTKELVNNPDTACQKLQQDAYINYLERKRNLRGKTISANGKNFDDDDALQFNVIFLFEKRKKFLLFLNYDAAAASNNNKKALSNPPQKIKLEYTKSTVN